MKTTISIPDGIFKDIEKLSKELHVSRSRILTDAAREYIEKTNNLRILEALNNAYSEKESKEETALRRKSREKYSKLLKDESW